MERHTPITSTLWRLLGALAALVVAFGLPPASLAAAGSARLDIVEVNTTNYPTVKVTFSANDADGWPITGLDQRAFQVAENGQEQAVVSAYALRNSTTPLAVMLAFDTSAGMKDEGKLDQAKGAAKTFISQMRPIDKLGLVPFDSSLTVAAPFTSDRAALTKKIEGLTAQGNTRLYDALYLAINEAAAIEGSRAVVLLTDGQDTESAADLSQVLALAREKGIKVYAIGVGSDVDERVLGQIARTSGGYFYKAPGANDIASAFKLMSDQLRNRYEITYTSPAAAAQGAKMEVKVAADTPGGRIVGATSYLMPAYSPKSRPTDAVGGQLGAVAQAAPTVGIANWMVYGSSLLAGLGVLLSCGGMALARSTRAREQRLRYFIGNRGAGDAPADDSSLLGAITVGLLRVLSMVSTRLLPPSHVRRFSHKLVLAGNPYGWRVNHFATLKTGLAGGLAFVGLLLFFRPDNLLPGLLLTLLLGVLGFYLPNVWLGRRIRARQKEILKSLPDALDLLSISVEAGLGLDGALLEVVNKWDNALADEFAIVLAELKMGRSRKEALRALAARTGVQEVATFTSALVQADELGMGIARPLALQAQQMRVKRRQRAEKLAHEASVKMVIPMALFIMPAIFIVILGPAFSQIFAMFATMR